MNGGRVAKRLLAVALALSTLVTLGLYYNGLPGNYRQDTRNHPHSPSLAAPSPRALGGGPAGPDDAPDWPAQPADGDDDLLSNDVAKAPPLRSDRRPDVPPRVQLSAAVDRDTCPELPLANTTIETATEFSRFEFQVRRVPRDTVYLCVVVPRFAGNGRTTRNRPGPDRVRFDDDVDH